MNEQLLEKAKTANSAEELLSMAKEEGINLTEEEAAFYFDQRNAAEGELDDDELANVAGGSHKHSHSSWKCYKNIDFNDPGCEYWHKCISYKRNTKPGCRCGNCGYASVLTMQVNAGRHFCVRFFADGCENPRANILLVD
jgi:predicted ribosomally synthesized peptide with nif11-like leader